MCILLQNRDGFHAETRFTPGLTFSKVEPSSKRFNISLRRPTFKSIKRKLSAGQIVLFVKIRARTPRIYYKKSPGIGLGLVRFLQ